MHSAAASAERQSAEDLQRIAIEALSAAKSQGSAADAIADAEWTVEGGEIRVQTELSKTMLPMVINPEADEIIRAALRSAGAGALKLVLLPGAANAAAQRSPRRRGQEARRRRQWIILWCSRRSGCSMPRFAM